VCARLVDGTVRSSVNGSCRKGLKVLGDCTLSGTISVGGTTSIATFLVAVESVERVGEGVSLEFREVARTAYLMELE